MKEEGEKEADARLLSKLDTLKGKKKEAFRQKNQPLGRNSKCGGKNRGSTLPPKRESNRNPGPNFHRQERFGGEKKKTGVRPKEVGVPCAHRHVEKKGEASRRYPRDHTVRGGKKKRLGVALVVARRRKKKRVTRLLPFTPGRSCWGEEFEK